MREIGKAKLLVCSDKKCKNVMLMPQMMCHKSDIGLTFMNTDIPNMKKMSFRELFKKE